MSSWYNKSTLKRPIYCVEFDQKNFHFQNKPSYLTTGDASFAKLHNIFSNIESLPCPLRKYAAQMSADLYELWLTTNETVVFQTLKQSWEVT